MNVFRSPVNSLQPYFVNWPSGLDWSVEAHVEQFSDLYEKVLAGNQQLNLTRITAPQDFLEKHLWDSLAGILLASYCRNLAAASLIDIGTGGGFPGFPLAMIFPQWQVTLMDATRKKIAFLTTLGKELGMNNLRFLTGRVEVIAHQAEHREQYDFATLRAVGNTSLCAEYGLPLLKVGGTLVLYRGQWQASDEQALAATSEILGGEIKEIVPHQTPWSLAQRHYVYVTKVKPTSPLYPRAISIPKQNPL